MLKKKMLETNRAALIVTLLSVAFITACDKAPGDKSAENKANEVIVQVGGTAINNAAFEAYAHQRAQSRPMSGAPDERKSIIDEMVNRELIYQEGVKLGIDKKPEVFAEIENLKRNVLAGATIRAHIEATKFTEEAMRKEYDSHMGTMTSKEYHARHILVKSENEAKSIIGNLDKGTNFATLAKTKSQDPGSAKNGGDLSWFAPGQMVKPFSDAVIAMEKGAHSKMPVQSQFGWHIIKLEDTREIKPPEFDKVRENIRSMMQNKEVETYLAALKAKTKIEIKGEQKKPSAEPTPAATPKSEVGK